MDTIRNFGLIAIFLAALWALLISLFLSLKQKRFTMRLLFIALTAACVLAAFFGSARNAGRRNAIRNLEIDRKRYQDNRADYSPLEYQRLMDELDERAAALGVD